MSLQAIETRSIEDSLRHAHDGLSRAQSLASRLLGDLTGDEPTAEDSDRVYGPGLVTAADLLAGRIEGLVRDLERARQRLINTTPKATLVGMNNPNAQMAGRLG